MREAKKPPKRLAFVADPSQLDEQDTFFPFVNEALSRKEWEVYTFDVPDFSGNHAVQAKPLRKPVSFSSRASLTRGKRCMSLSDFDLFLLKKDPPIDAHYKRFLTALTSEKIPVINDPRGLLKMGTKVYLKHFSRITPKTFFAGEVNQALKCIKKMGNIVLKQSDSYGGKGVSHFHFRQGRYYAYSGNEEVPISEEAVSRVIGRYLENSGDKMVLIVEFLPSAPKRGDKRVVVLEGRILGSYLRLPDAESGMCVCANNGARRLEPTRRDREIVKILKPHFKKNGIALAALDLLTDEEGLEYLSEINVVNPGFCNLDVLHPELRVAKRVVDMLSKEVRQLPLSRK